MCVLAWKRRRGAVTVLTGEQVGEVIDYTGRAEELKVRPVGRVSVEHTSTDGVGLSSRDALPCEEVGDWVGEGTKDVGTEVGKSCREVKRVGCNVGKGAGGWVDGVGGAEEDVVCVWCKCQPCSVKYSQARCANLACSGLRFR